MMNCKTILHTVAFRKPQESNPGHTDRQY